jgi:branched-chain amino acid transport system ATP-binding protein
MAELVVENLRASYGAVQAVQGIDVRVASGECAAVLGANGSGKTTLMKSISGLVAHEGTVTVDGMPLEGSPEQIARAGVGHVLEGRQIFTHLTVRENLLLGRYGAANKKQPTQMDSLMDAFPLLKEKINRLGSQLSGGEQQQVAIARCLMAQPKVVLMDEPSLGLSPRVIEQVGEAIKHIRRDWGTTLLVAEQSISLVLDIATHFYVLRRGQVSYSGHGDPAVVFREVHRAYLGGGEPRRTD